MQNLTLSNKSLQDSFTCTICQGISFMPLTSNPQRTWKNASYSQYPRAADFVIMGYSMTTLEPSKRRFTAWVDFDISTNTTKWTMTDSRCGFELYDHENDPDENINLAMAPDSTGEVNETVANLFQQLQAGWRATAQIIGH